MAVDGIGDVRTSEGATLFQITSRSRRGSLDLRSRTCGHPQGFNGLLALMGRHDVNEWVLWCEHGVGHAEHGVGTSGEDLNAYAVMANDLQAKLCAF